GIVGIVFVQESTLAVEQRHWVFTGAVLKDVVVLSANVHLHAQAERRNGIRVEVIEFQESELSGSDVNLDELHLASGAAKSRSACHVGAQNNWEPVNHRHV